MNVKKVNNFIHSLLLLVILMLFSSCTNSGDNIVSFDDIAFSSLEDDLMLSSSHTDLPFSSLRIIPIGDQSSANQSAVNESSVAVVSSHTGSSQFNPNLLSSWGYSNGGGGESSSQDVSSSSGEDNIKKILNIFGYDQQSDDGVYKKLSYFSQFSLGNWGGAVIEELNNSGAKTLKVTFDAGGASGVFFKFTNLVNLSEFQNGELVFDVQSGSNPNLLVKLETSQEIFNESNISNLVSLNNQWQTVTVPLSEMSAIDLTTISVPFGVHLGVGEVSFRNIRIRVWGQNVSSQSQFSSSNNSGGGGSSQIINSSSSGDDHPGGNWNLIWSDEFNDGALNADYWSVEQLDPPHNEEKQYYTAGYNQNGSNVNVGNGMLTLEARRENVGSYQYTSGKISSQGKYEFQYGRLEAKIKLPKGNGLWPAFWLLGANINSVGWPKCGEIDIMEGKGRVANWSSGAIHRGPAWNQDYVYSEEYIAHGEDLTADFHIYSLEWKQGEMHWEVDGNRFMSAYDDGGGVDFWPFEQKQFIILNVAVGGWFDNGLLPNDSDLPAQMNVDWVRVYQ